MLSIAYNGNMGHAQSDAELTAAFRGGDLSAREKMTQRYYGLVMSYCNDAAKRMPSHIWGDDLLSYGFDGLLRAINKWDVAGGANFASFLKMHVGFAIADGLRADNKTREAKRWGIAFSQFETDEDAPGESHRDGGAQSVADDNPVDVEKLLLHDQIWRSVINKSRSGYDKQILHGYFKYGLTMRQIGEKMGLTDSSISQDIKAALVEVRRRVNFKYAARQRKNYPAVDICLSPECDGSHYMNGLCYMHYKRFKKHGQIDLIGLVCSQNEIVEKCHWHGCDKPHAHRHLCEDHLLEWKRDRGLVKKCDTPDCAVVVGDDQPLCKTCWSRQNAAKYYARPCKIEGCLGTNFKKGLCYDHFSAAEGMTKCLTEDCGRNAVTKGLCNGCYIKSLPKTTGPCQKKGCSKLAHRANLCRQHYMEMRQDKGVLADCSADGCNEPVYGNGLCQHHYGKQKMANKTKPCAVLGCDRREIHDGLCNHHRRILKPFLKPWAIKVCAMDGCGKTAYCKGFCTKHYQSQKVKREELVAA